MSERFNLCLPFILAQECPYPNAWSNPANFSNDAHDPGGATMCGIIQVEYDRWRRVKGLATKSVILITKDEGYAIYHDNYWLPKCPYLAVGLDLEFCDISVNFGPTGATRILQDALGVGVDGIWGPITDAAVHGITDVATFITTFANARLAHYKQLWNWPYFGRGWTNRTNEIRTDALSMTVTPAGIRTMRPYDKSKSVRVTDPVLRRAIQVRS